MSFLNFKKIDHSCMIDLYKVKKDHFINECSFMKSAHDN